MDSLLIQSFQQWSASVLITDSQRSATPVGSASNASRAWSVPVSAPYWSALWWRMFCVIFMSSWEAVIEVTPRIVRVTSATITSTSA